MDVFKSIEEIDYGKVKWVDTRFSLNDREEGKRKFAKGHVAGAVYWDLEEDLSDMTKKAGRHPLPDKEKLTALFRKSGLSLNDDIIVYDDGGSPFAARAWWLLRYAGFQNAFIAIEGFEQLKASGVPISTENEIIPPTEVVPVWNETIHAPRSFIEETVAGKTGAILLDARSAERYRGVVEPIDRVAGHIPGALNFDWEQLKLNGSFNLGSEVKDQLEKTVSKNEDIAVYCGSGVTAAPLYALLKHNGYEHVKLYVGSFSEWISKADAPVEKTNEL